MQYLMYTGSFLQKQKPFNTQKKQLHLSGNIENFIPQISDVNGVCSDIVVLLDDNFGLKKLGNVDQDGQDQNWDGVG